MGCEWTIKASLTIQSDIDASLVAREKIHNRIESYLSKEDTETVLFVCHELINNAVEHGNKNNSEKKIFVDIESTYGEVRISIADQGDGFDWRERVNRKIDMTNFEDRGRGIIFCAAMVDSVFYNEKGNKVTISKKRKKEVNNL